MTPDQQTPGASAGSPWFAVSTGLLGLIVGYGLSTAFVGGSLMGNGPAPAAPGAPAAPDAAAEDPMANAQPADVDDDPVLGSDSATVTLIEFTDFQCPFCGRHFDETFGKIKSDYVDTGKVKYVVRDYPLSFHPFAHKAAEAAGCANAQGKFWEMHDKLFSNQATWSALSDAVPAFKQYAADLKLNTSKFDSCLDNGDMAAEVDADEAAGSAAGISGTPGFWILGPNGQSKAISGAYPYETFKAAFDAML